MKKLFLIFIVIVVLLSGCSTDAPIQIVATTLPVYEFTSFLCQGTGITVGQLVQDNVSCLHDYALQVSQMRAIESAETIVISGAGLEAFLADAIEEKSNIVNASVGIEALCHSSHDEHDDAHHHESDPHIWLSISNARAMAHNICSSLSVTYPQFQHIFSKNLQLLDQKFDALEEYGQNALRDLSCRDLITFHDGFGYLAHYFDLNILKSIEEESGSEASAAELVELIQIVNSKQLPAIFTEVNGSVSAADIISRETGVKVYTLDMATTTGNYFDAMYRNIDTIKEALG